MLRCTKPKANKVYTGFWDTNTALKGLKEYVEIQYKKRGGKRGGYLVGLDGRKLSVRSEHAMVNLLFQSAGNIIMRVAWCYLWNNWIPKEGLRAHKILDMHDEQAALVHIEDTPRYIQLANAALPAASKYFNTNVIFTGECVIGKNWCQVH